jgi:hypothetical protein
MVLRMEDRRVENRSNGRPRRKSRPPKAANQQIMPAGGSASVPASIAGTTSILTGAARLVTAPGEPAPSEKVSVLGLGSRR